MPPSIMNELNRKEQLHSIMMTIPVDWRYYWCGANACGCLGCVNKSGGLATKGFTQEEHAQWVRENPKLKTNNQTTIWIYNDNT